MPEITLDPGFGSHVPQAQRITETGQTAGYTGRANRPWGTPGRAQYVGLPYCEVQIDAEDQWTPESYFVGSHYDTRSGDGYINLSIRGEFQATLTLQRSLDDGETWQDVKTYTAAVEEDILNPNNRVKWRLGVKPGDFVSSSESTSNHGLITAILSQA